MDATDQPHGATDRRDGRADSREAILNDMAQHWTRHASARERIEGELVEGLTAELIDVLTWVASGRRTSAVAELVSGGGVSSGADPAWCATLGLVLSRHGEHREEAVTLLSHAVRVLPKLGERRRYGLELLAHLLDDGSVTEATRLNEELGFGEHRKRTWVPVDVARARLAEGAGTADEWRAVWHDFYRGWGLSTPSIDMDAATRLFGVASPHVTPTPDSDMVSVVLEVGEAEADELDWTLRSVLSQSWSSVQTLLVVDIDPLSDERIEPYLDEPGVTVVGIPPGTSWREREQTILEAVTGTYLTWNPSGRWSHPERLAHQVEALSDDQRIACYVSALTAGDDLSLITASEEGLAADHRTCLVRTADARDVGGRLQLGDLAEEELVSRLQALSARGVRTLDEPLLIRRATGAVRRRRLRPSGRTAVAADIRQLFTAWHATADHHELASISQGGTGAERLAELSVLPQQIECDILMAGDWHSFGGPQKSMLEEIEAFLRAGKSVAIMHLQPGRFVGTGKESLSEVAAEIVLSGQVRLAQPRDEVQVTTTFLRYPPTVQFRSSPLQVSQDRLVIVANQAPSERDGSDVRYRVEDVRRHAREVFGMTAVWAPQGPQVREALEGRVPDDELLPYDLPGVLDVDAWAQDRRRRRADRPVIGRHSRDNVMKWPERRQELLSIYPDSSDVDVRVMGGAKAVRAVLGGEIPSRWLALDRDEMSVRTFLNSLDFFVYFQHSEAYDAFGRAMLEALATGVVTILPPRMEPVFGDAALYAEPADVMDIVHDLFAHPTKYRRQSERALAYVRENFSLDAHLARVERIITGTGPQATSAT